MIHIGIDPGHKGAVAALDDDGGFRAVVDMPSQPCQVRAGQQVDAGQLAAILRGMLSQANGHHAISLELAQGGQGMQRGNAKTWEDFGAIRGVICAVTGREPELVHAKAWQRRQLPPGPSQTTKQRAIKQVRKTYPEVLLTPEGCRVPKDGRADAILIARDGWQQYGKAQDYAARCTPV